ncbi:MAG: calcium-binding protein, partial [Negativicutes bacterium]
MAIVWCWETTDEGKKLIDSSMNVIKSWAWDIGETIAVEAAIAKFVLMLKGSGWPTAYAASMGMVLTVSYKAKGIADDAIMTKELAFSWLDYLSELMNYKGTEIPVDPRMPREYRELYAAYFAAKNDPIALDLDGDGVEFVKSGAYFDYDGNKFSEKATWLGKDDGWLTRDVNGDGTINDGTELFGDSMKKKDGTLAKNGFDALGEYDDNKDGKIDSADAIYSQLRVWQDVNGNGISDAGELKTLSELGIKQLNLNKTDVTGAEQTNGESVRQQGSFVWNSGVTGQMNGYVVNREAIDSKETELLPVPDDVKALPDVRGWGNVHSLQQAIVRDASGELKALVVSFTNATSKTEREQLAEKIMLKWCGTDKVDPNSRGGYFDARQLTALEKLFGEPYLGGHGANPNQFQAPILKEIYSKLTDELYCELLIKSTALQFIIQPTVDASGKVNGYNLDYAKQMLDGIIAIDSTAGLELLGNYWRVAKCYGFADAINSEYEKYLDFYSYYREKGAEYASVFVVFGNQSIADLPIIGSAGEDVLIGTSQNDKIYGLVGNDTVTAGAGDDLVNGGAGNDVIVGGINNDILKGGDGDDVIYGDSETGAFDGMDGN